MSTPRFLRLAACTALTGLALAVPASFGQVTTEAQLKAAYLVNFLKYVEWPVQRPALTICLFGRDRLGPSLASYEGRQIGGRELKIRRVGSPSVCAAAT